MVIVTKKEFLEWVNSQPKDKRTNSSNNHINDDCRCLMVEFGKDRNFDFNSCSERSWLGYNKRSEMLSRVAVFEDGISFSDLYPKDLDNLDKGEFSYGEIQEFLSHE